MEGAMAGYGVEKGRGMDEEWRLKMIICLHVSINLQRSLQRVERISLLLLLLLSFKSKNGERKEGSKEHTLKSMLKLDQGSKSGKEEDGD